MLSWKQINFAVDALIHVPSRLHDANVRPFNVWNTRWKTCRPIYVYIVSNILSQVIFFFFGGGDFNVLLMKLKQKKNTNYLRLKINYKNSYIHRNLARSHQSRHHTGPTLTAEIPTPGNLKSGVSPFCITPANPAPLLAPISLGHYMFLHEVQNIIIRFYDREGETENWNLLPLSVFPSSGGGCGYT